MAAAEDELELAAAGRAEDSDRLRHAPAAHVVLELPVEARHPVGVDEALVDVAELLDGPRMDFEVLGPSRRPVSRELVASKPRVDDLSA